MDKIRRIYVEKKPPANTESIGLFSDLKNNLNIQSLENARLVNCYDVTGVTDEVYKKCISYVFTEAPVDIFHETELDLSPDEITFGVKYLPGQYDQRADWAESAIKVIMGEESALVPTVVSSKFYVLKGKLTDEELAKIKAYTINPVDSMEIGVQLPESLISKPALAGNVKTVENFIDMDDEDLSQMLKNMGLAMSFEDLIHCRDYFKNQERRNPTVTEIKVLDTYWSDHCRHTTFLTNIQNVEIEDGKYSKPIKEAFKAYLSARKEVYGDREKAVSLMDIAQMGMRYLKKKGVLKNLDESEEINACSIKVSVDVDGIDEEWLIMFKNETHNHPTEIEPFGGAATCLGGAIRDPLSGRAYVYQAMRVTGSGDPTVPVSQTLAGKLPQRKITLGAASGYSSYGNQIGLATGHVAEIYDEGYIAKRMEIGAVVGAVKAENVVREIPSPGDIIILLGGRTGRDGCGGATGSSKVHTDESILESGAEVQKGNPPTERKIQRLFRRPEVTKLIKRCNDFGAGGVCVAIGELADSLEIDLDKVPKKYDGLDGTELAISESQERMAVVVAKENADKFIELSGEENLEATIVAVVTDNNRLIMKWRGTEIVDISRDFLNTNGAEQFANVKINAPKELIFEEIEGNNLEEKWLNNLASLNVCAQKGLVERFDSTIGAGTILMPFGGKFQFTPAQAMAAAIPVEGKTETATVMAYGFNPKFAKWSPFHSAMYAVVESVSKVVAAGGDPSEIKLTFQEYFERLKDEPQRWGKPFAALLGTLQAQFGLELASIGGKDSMSGSFNTLDVPPTLVSFAISPAKAKNIISPEFKKENSVIAAVFCEYFEDGTIDFEKLKALNSAVFENIKAGRIVSAHTIGYGGMAEALSKMSFGNRIGFDVQIDKDKLFMDNYGGFVFELDCSESEFNNEFEMFEKSILGKTSNDMDLTVNGLKINHFTALSTWLKPLESVFPTKLLDDIEFKNNELKPFVLEEKSYPALRISKPKVFIPVFPGSNCEFDTKRAFEKFGAEVETFVIKSFTPAHLHGAAKIMAESIKASQIVALPGGFSAGDEPEGSGKFITAMFRSPYVKEAVSELLSVKKGLMIGICNGFQALMKLGLIQYGEIRDLEENSPTLTFNEIGRHISCVVNTKIISNKSPWLWGVKPGEIHRVSISHGEGRFVADEKIVKSLEENGQIATQYVQLDGMAANCFEFNPNGSIYAVEGVTSPDGRVFGKMGHSERVYKYSNKNVIGDYDQKIFESGVNYFK